MMRFSHIALSCQDLLTTERWYTRHFGFRRARVFMDGDKPMIVFIKRDDVYLELFNAEGERPTEQPEGDGLHSVGIRHLAFQVDDVDAVLAQLGDSARVTLGPLSFDAFIPGWKTVWVADPDGNIVEISQGYVDEENPIPLEMEE
jgi:glyoxylase I family protein